MGSYLLNMRTNKVYYFKPLVEWILRKSKIITFIIFTCIVYVIFRYILNSLSFSNIDAILGYFSSSKYAEYYKEFIVLLCSGIITVFFSLISRLIKKWQDTIPHIKSYIYTKLTNIVNYEKMPNWKSTLITNIIRVFYFHPREILPAQQEILNKVFQVLKESSEKKDIKSKIIWIEGEPFSGKTMTILNLFVDLITKKGNIEIYCKLDKNIVYVDINRENFDLICFQKEYQSGKFAKDLVIIDNLHRVSGGECFTIIETVIHDFNALAIIILLRKPEDFLCENERIFKLHEMMQNYENKFSLKPITQNDFSYKNDNVILNFCKEFSNDENIFFENPLLVHFSNLYIKGKQNNSYIIDLIKNILLSEESENHKVFSDIMISVIACSIFTGGFHLDIMTKCLPSLTSGKSSARCPRVPVGVDPLNQNKIAPLCQNKNDPCQIRFRQGIF